FPRGRLTFLPLTFGFLFVVLVASLLLAPGSEANRRPDPQASQPVTTKKPTRAEFVPGEALVRFKQDRAFEGARELAVPNQDAIAQANSLMGTTTTTSTEEVLVQVEHFEGSDLVDGLRIARTAPEDTLKAVAALAARDDVLYAEPNYILHSDATPNDPSFGQLYGMTKIGMPQAWDTITGSTGSSQIVVGIVDEGVDVKHPDLQANIWTNPAPGSLPGFSPKVQLSAASYTIGEGGGAATVTVNRDPGDLHGFDFVRTTGDIPAESHGTHVAGTIGAVGNNGVGVVGVNWRVGIMSLRFIDQTTNNGNEADAIKAYNYARQMRALWLSSGGTQGANVRVLNNSYGGSSFSQASLDAISALNTANILFVAAAGNESTNNDAAPHFPSNYDLPNVISVAATDSNDGLAGFSNFGARSVLLGAPGVGILSTTPNNSYSFFSGTSMATPHVTGAAALLLAQNPNLTVAQLRALLEFNGDVVSALAGKSVSGRRLNVANSLQALASNDVTPPGTVTSFQISSQTGRTVNLSWISSGDDGAVGNASLYEISFTDSTTNATTTLTTVIPTATGTAQNVSVNIPYRHTAGTIKLREFDNVGNEGTPATVSVNVDSLIADPYIPSLAAPAALSTGGTGLAFNCDDCYRTRVLPFTFTYFGSNYTSIKVGSNGTIYFEPPTAPTRTNGEANDVPSSVGGMSPFRMIAGMWDDLDLRTSRRADADVFVVSDATHLILRWQGVQFGDGVTGGPINFEIELNSNGVIKTRYGSGNTNLLPVVGISGGEPDVYSIGALTSESSPISLTNAQSAVFTPRSLGPIAPPDAISTPEQTRAPLPSSAVEPSPAAQELTPAAGNVTVAFATADTAGAQPCSTVNGKASSRCDYMTTLGTLSFADGENSKTVRIPIIDDSFADGTENFTVTLSNALGVPMGTQTTATITITDNDSTSAGNPLDTSAFFVRQHYLDFLNREPDASGLAFWTGNIDNCTPQPSCTEAQRINTSAAFFLSIEFQDTGYLVERLYKAAYGSPNGNSTFGGAHTLPVPVVRFAEFLPDTQQIGQGVVVGQGAWQQQLEDNKVAFIAQFVQRSRFTTAFPSAMTSAQFVDALNLNAGNPLSPAERDQLVSDLSTAAKTRAQVLRAVAEDPDLKTAEFNRAFVLMQFFGYLRRNPDDPQDNDYTGYDFWLTKLNSFTQPGDDPLVRAQKADMVKAFISSAEYRQRVGL
ncbi:MAG: serine protease, partial [Blastocatellia bacterium]|nr:serine protease [Blastocatellia bacterium]